jgi:hypothetical protein
METLVRIGCALLFGAIAWVLMFVICAAYLQAPFALAIGASWVSGFFSAAFVYEITGKIH